MIWRGAIATCASIALPGILNIFSNFGVAELKC
jgi:hypothetical protein